MARHSLIPLIALFLLCITLSASAKQHRLAITAPAILANGGGKGTSQAILDNDRARLRRMTGKQPKVGAPRIKSAASTGKVSVRNSMFYYTADVYVGTPAKKFQLLLDTGSANSWVRTGYSTSSSSRSTGDSVEVTYGLGHYQGTEYRDTVRLGSFSAKGYSIGQATDSDGFADVGGILALGPTALSRGTFTRDSKQVPHFVEVLLAQKQIRQAQFSVYFQPTSLTSSQNGEITIGGIDTTKGVGRKFTMPRTRNRNARQYWGVDMEVMHGSRSLGRGSGITDTGTTLFLMASQLYDAYLREIKSAGAYYDEDTGLIAIKSSNVPKVPTIHLRLDKNKLPLIGDAQFFPEADSLALGGRKGYRYGIVSDTQADLGEDVDFLLGAKALERFLTGYDLSTGRMTFQQTAFTSKTYAQMGKFMRRDNNATYVDPLFEEMEF